MIVRSPDADIVVPEISLTEYVFRNAASRLDKPALIDGASGRTLTYGQLVGASRKVAAGLIQRGLRKGDVLALYSPNLPEYAVAFHGVVSAGGTVTTVNPLYTAHELTLQLQDSGAKFLLTVPPLLEKAQEAAQAVGIGEIFVFGEAEGATPFAALLQNDGQFPPVTINPHEDIVVLPYSSGTTGLPKGVMLTHYTLVANLEQSQRTDWGLLQLTRDDVAIGVLPMFHIYGMFIFINYMLVLGGTIVTLPRFDLEQFLGVLQNYGVTYAHLVPPIILALAKHPLVDKYDLSKLRAILSAAAPLGKELETACAARLGCTVGQAYGMTEASPLTHCRPITPESNKLGSIGVPVASTEVRVVDVATWQDLGPNQDGELWIRGPQIMKGYLNNPNATHNTVDREGWLHSGDIGYYDDDGYFFIVDRLKELIKYKGYQVAPAELEAVLLGHPAVGDVAVIGHLDEEAGETPKAYVVLKGEATAQDLMDFVAGRVAPYKRIRDVEFLEQIPKSASGKILRRMLVARDREQAGVTA